MLRWQPNETRHRAQAFSLGAGIHEFREGLMAEEGPNITARLRSERDSACPIGIGGDLVDRSPATPPGMRVRTGRFEKLRS
jgi:hypothetical protein